MTKEYKPWQFKPWKEWWPWRPKGSRNAESLFREAIAKIAKDQKVEDIEIDIVNGILNRAKEWELEAVKIYLDRVYWKPKQTIEQDNSHKLDLSDNDGMEALQYLLDLKKNGRTISESTQ